MKGIQPGPGAAIGLAHTTNTVQLEGDMPCTYFDRFLSPRTMMKAEEELLGLGERVVPILDSLFSGEACNEFGVQYRTLGLPRRCAIAVCGRLGPKAKPLESYLREEVGQSGHYAEAAANALGAFQSLEPDTVEVLARSLNKDWSLAFEAASAIIKCGEQQAGPVLLAIHQSERAASVFDRVSAWHRRRQV